MKKEVVIGDAQAVDLVDRMRQLTSKERSLLRLWCFHNNPPPNLTIIVDSDYQYGFSYQGERLGLVDYWNCPGDDMLYFHGDNGILYLGERDVGFELKFNAQALETSLKEIQKRKRRALDLLGPAI